MEEPWIKRRYQFTTLIEQYSNDEELKISEMDNGVSARCKCLIEEDTIVVNMGFGHFGGMGIELKIYNDKFRSAYYEYGEIESFKYNVTDTTLTKFIHLNSKLQKLEINGNPTFKSGQ